MGIVKLLSAIRYNGEPVMIHTVNHYQRETVGIWFEDGRTLEVPKSDLEFVEKRAEMRVKVDNQF